MKILVMGLPGSGKTTLSESIVAKITSTVDWFNADIVRTEYNDWDFSEEGRLRQCDRMISLSDSSSSKFTICDFVAPTEIIRQRFDSDIIIWMNTIPSSIFDDTNAIFEIPEKYDIEVTTKNSDYWSDFCIDFIENYYDNSITTSTI